MPSTLAGDGSCFPGNRIENYVAYYINLFERLYRLPRCWIADLYALVFRFIAIWKTDRRSKKATTRTGMAAVVEAVGKTALTEEQNRLIEILSRIASNIHSPSMSYTNAVLTVGYAGALDCGPLRKTILINGGVHCRHCACLFLSGRL